MKEQNATDKKILPVKPENIPEELKVRPQWVVWKAVSEKPEAHPLQLAMLGATHWRLSYENYTDGLRREPREIEDLSEP